MIVTSLIVDDELDVSAVIRRKQVYWLTQWMGKRTGFGEERDLGSWMFKRFVHSLLFSGSLQALREIRSVRFRSLPLLVRLQPIMYVFSAITKIYSHITLDKNLCRSSPIKESQTLASFSKNTNVILVSFVN